MFFVIKYATTVSNCNLQRKDTGKKFLCTRAHYADEYIKNFK